MQKNRLLAIIIIFAIFLETACTIDSFPVSSNTTKEEKSEGDKYEALAEELNRELALKTVQLTGYAEIVGATLEEPIHQFFAVNREFTIKGNVENYSHLKGPYVWIKMEHLDSDMANHTYEYYSPLVNGEYEQIIHFFNGEGKYSIQIMLPNNERNNYFSELATFEVINVNPKIERDIIYTPFAIKSGLVMDKPLTGLIQSDEVVSLSGKLLKADGDDTIMLQIKKDDESWQHIIPLKDGEFSYDLPLFFGQGIHEVHVLVPDLKLEDSYQYASTMLVDNTSDKQMEPIEFHRGYEERGIQLESPSIGGKNIDLLLQIKGEIDSAIQNASEITHLYVRTKKDQDEALDIIPVQNFAFDDTVYLRFGPGKYDVTINIPEPRKENSAYFSFTSVATFTANNIAPSDHRDLLPSRGIQSDFPEIIELASKITKDKQNNHEKAKAIYEYTAKNIAYDVEKFHHYNFEWDDSAIKTLETEKGVCQDYAYLAAALLRASHIEARFVTGTAGAGHVKDNHAWVEAKVDGDWLVMDPTWGSGYIKNDQFVAHYTDEYFDPNEIEFKKTHIREKPEY
ncbi:transglutaminase domain-containing protein [Lederbergia lenta]|uniref:transglutaminase domain-containing protein n=1 Tax=Lederbergia lenta TaxID=1467 RepID=UPI00203F4D89|nr:transglutaminase-like domain-containing protein [Lederbergia lenta]MCM3109456.1 transglutaminase-like domain-containing protein [Lederbergia lenta]